MTYFYIRRLLYIDIEVTLSRESVETLSNGVKVFCTTLKRSRPINTGK